LPYEIADGKHKGLAIAKAQHIDVAVAMEQRPIGFPFVPAAGHYFLMHTFVEYPIPPPGLLQSWGCSDLIFMSSGMIRKLAKNEAMVP
jgi:hypothetical protein